MDGPTADSHPSFVPDQPPHPTFVPDEPHPSFVPDSDRIQTPDQPHGILRQYAGGFMAALTGDQSWSPPEDQKAIQGLNDALEAKRRTGMAVSSSPEVIKNSAFEGIQTINKEVKDATRGLHLDEEAYQATGNPLAISRYVDKTGKPIDSEDVENGIIPKEEVQSEPPLDYFMPGLRGKPTPYFQSHAVNSAVAQAFDSNDPTLLQTMHSELLGSKELITDPHSSGFYKYLAGPITEGEQGIARGSAFLLQKIGQMPPEDAKQLLSQEELHNHDIVDYYGLDKVQGGTARIALATTGFLADFFDPLMWAGTAQKIVKVGEDAVSYGGRLITDYGQMSKFEATNFKLTQDIRKIITTDGKTLGAGAAEHTTAENLKALDNWSAEPGRYNFDDLSNQLNLSPEGQAAATAAKESRMANTSVMQQIASGERQMVLKIPFTDHALEVPVLSDLMQMGGQGAANGLIGIKNGIGRALESTNRFVAAQGAIGAGASEAVGKALDFGSAVASKIDLLATNTARPLFNGAARIFMNDQAYARYQMGQFKDTWYKAFMGADGKVDGTPLKEAMNLLDIEPQRSNEWYADKFADGQLSDAQKAKLDGARLQAQQMRSTMSSNQIKLVEEIQKQNLSMADQMYARGIKFIDNNPLEEGNNATGYIKHMITRDFISQYKNSDEAAQAAKDFVSSRTPGFDGSQLERGIKEPISETNESYLKAKENKNGIKMFVEDPIAAHTARMKDMQDQLRNHDLLHTLDDLAIYRKYNEPMPEGFAKIDPEAMGQSPMRLKDQNGAMQETFTQFLPDKMKNWIDQGHDVYLPEDVNTRLEYMLNPHGQGGTVSAIMNNGAFKLQQYLFRNTALFGTGYLGMRAMSHMNTALYSGTDVGKIFDALKVITPNILGGEEMFSVAGREMSKAQVFDQAVQDGVLHTGFMSEDDWGHVVENIATTAPRRAELMKGPATVFDHAMGFSLNRAISSGIDDVGKLAHYMDRLEKGYTRAGAAESAEFWFYNYDRSTPAQKMTSAIIPFSSTGMKTVEQTLISLKEMNVAHLTLPEKVNSVLSGNYIGSAEERKFISEVVPNWQKSNIYGPMMPGSREMMIEFPWVYHTMNAFWSPFTSEKNDLSSMPVNPLLKLLGTGLVAAKSGSMTEFTDENSVKEFATQMASSYLPPLFKNSLAMYQILHPEQAPGYIDFQKWYTPRSAFDPKTKEDAQANQKFANAAEFGRWIEKEYGLNSTMNMYLTGSPEEPKGPVEDSAGAIHEKYYSNRAMAIDAGIGNFVRSHFRDLTGGFSRATALDMDFMSRDSALNKQAKAIQSEAKTLDSRLTMGLEVPGAIFTEKYRENILSGGTDEQKALLTKHMAIQDKREALHEFYGQVLKDSSEKTGIFRQILGMEPNRVNFTSIPHGLESIDSKENYRKLLESPEE